MFAWELKVTAVLLVMGTFVALADDQSSTPVASVEPPKSHDPQPPANAPPAPPPPPQQSRPPVKTLPEIVGGAFQSALGNAQTSISDLLRTVASHPNWPSPLSIFGVRQN